MGLVNQLIKIVVPYCKVEPQCLKLDGNIRILTLSLLASGQSMTLTGVGESTHRRGWHLWVICPQELLL
jgi:hypothetical protein